MRYAVVIAIILSWHGLWQQSRVHAQGAPSAQGARETQTALSKPTLRVGAAAVDVTPKSFPVRMPGGFRAKYGIKAHDPLHARTIVFDDGKIAFAMVVVDALSLSPEVMDEARAKAAKSTGIPATRMLISSTHSHTTPSSNVKTGPEPAVAYRKQLVQGIAASITEAHAARRPASVAASSHPLADEVFNRRWFLKPGKMPKNPFGKYDKVKMNPGRGDEVLDRPAGPTDPDITLISVQDSRRKPIAIYANYALHYVGGIPRGEVSADYFGEFARLMPNRVKGDDQFVAMMSNGASGDINNIPFTVTRPPRAPFEQIRIVARKAADTAWFAYKKIEKHRSDVTLGMMERRIKLKYRKPSDEMVADAKAVQAVLDSKNEEKKQQLPRLADAYARRVLSAAKRPEHLEVPIQAIRIGDIAVCAIPFETLVEIGLDIKKRSPFATTIVVGLANGRYGYLPTPKQHTLGGYETWLGTCQVQKDASVIVTRQLLEMLGELKRE